MCLWPAMAERFSIRKLGTVISFLEGVFALLIGSAGGRLAGRGGIGTSIALRRNGVLDFCCRPEPVNVDRERWKGNSGDTIVNY